MMVQGMSSLPWLSTAIIVVNITEERFQKGDLHCWQIDHLAEGSLTSICFRFGTRPSSWVILSQSTCPVTAVLEIIPTGNLCCGGLNTQLQRMLSEVLPTGGMPVGLHVNQDDLMGGGELYSSLSGGGITGGPGGFG